jgi:hypothetical protein
MRTLLLSDLRLYGRRNIEPPDHFSRREVIAAA